MRAFRISSVVKVLGLALALTVALPLSQQAANGQAISQNGGSIQGVVTDPGGAVIPGAKIVISSPETGFSRTLTSDSAGLYSIGPLNPGSYTVTVDAPGFAHTIIKTVVSTGTVSSGNVKLQVSSTGETVEVSAGDVQVNTEQAGVAGVVTQDQIQSLPINGRNILDIAQIQPGVILQSGQSFDPTKTAYSALGVNGQNGRTTRILVDGQDISDETVGTVLFNVPEGAIGEFQLNRANQDVSGEVTSTGQVLMVTQTGTNRFHGNAFGNFQDARAGFAGINGLSGDESPFQRDQFGGYVGGPILKDRLFFFGGAERNKQFDSSPVNHGNALLEYIYNQWGQVPDPFKDTFSTGRLDYNGPWGMHLFARAMYSNNISFGTSGQDPYAFFSNQNNVPSIVGGADLTTGHFTHSVRFGYLKFINNIAAAADSLGAGIYNPSATLGIPFEMIGALYAGSGNEDAPQHTYQTSKSFRYDGTWTKGAHNIKFGGEASRIVEGGYAAFYNTFLADFSTNAAHWLPKCAIDPSQAIGGDSSTWYPGAPSGSCLGDPLYGYSSAEFVFGNGNGSFSERPAFGLPGGGNFSWRLSAYVGDTWKIKPYLTLVAGLRWSTDTDRANQDLATPTCGQVDPALQYDGCSSANASSPIFDQFNPNLGLGKRTNQPYNNFGPQLGLIFSPGNHKYVLRGGIGIFYDSNLFNNTGNSRAGNTPAEFPGFTYGINNYTQSSLNLPGFANGITGVASDGSPCSTPDKGDCSSWKTIYSMPFAESTLLMSKLDAQYKAASAVPQPNAAFIGENMTSESVGALYGGPYKTPYSIQINGGVQYEIKPGLVLNVDYVHNATLKVPLPVDVNHNGAARTLNTTAAANAIAATLDAYGVTSIDDAIAAGASIDDFASEGLTSGGDYLSGYPAIAYGLPNDYGAAFPGTNPNVGTGSFILPVGKSAYDALQIVVQQQKQHPLPGIVSSNAQISYNLSQVVTNSGAGSNQFFVSDGAYDNDNVDKFIGRNGQDHTNMLSLATSFTVKYGPQIALVGHFFSAAPSNLNVTNSGILPLSDPQNQQLTTGGALFKSDLDGDGTTGDLMPGTMPGAYMHDVKGKRLSQMVDNWNTYYAGKLTPAGQALVDAGLMTPKQLYNLGGVMQPLLSVPTNPLRNPATRALDASFSYPITYLKRFREGLVITPKVSFYNVTNMANYGSIGTLDDYSSYYTTGGDSSTGTLGTLVDNRNSSTTLTSDNTFANLTRGRTLRGSGNGTYDQGGPRSAEFSLRIDF